MPDTDFDYDIAFQRNRGFLNSSDQERLRRATVAIAGLGGTGGAQVQALARLGVGRFHIADLDAFEMLNFNRQAGAFMHTIGQRKTAVAADFIKGINPEADVTVFDEGINDTNIDKFLDGVDLVVDSLDFYCFHERFLLYPAARRKKLWVITAPPLGFGFTFLAFDPRGMHFEDYFGFSPASSKADLMAGLVVGISPSMFSIRYLDKDAITIKGGRLPSVSAAPFMIAGVIATEALGILLGQGSRICAPQVYEFDAYLRKFRKSWFPFGMRSPMQRIKRSMVKRKLID